MNFSSYKKTAIRLFKFCIAFILLLYIGLFIAYTYGSRMYYSKKEVKHVIAEIDRAPELPDNFYIIYDRLYNDRHEKITHRHLKTYWTEFLLDIKSRNKNWQYQAALWAPVKPTTYDHRINHEMFLAFELNKSLTPEKCFNYVMASRYEEYCKTFRIKDTITNLTEPEQIIKFIVANERAWYYRRHPGHFRRETDSLQNIIR